VDDEDCGNNMLCIAEACVADETREDAGISVPIDAGPDAEIPATCLDRVKNGDEGDVDCGGAFCPKCAPEAACNVDNDCSTGQCAGNNTCLAATSCLVLRDSDASPPSGVYFLDTDGPGGPSPPFRAYCDMDRDGGGWTLVMKLTTGTNTFNFASTYWTTTALFNENDLVPNTNPVGGEAKYEAFNQIEGTQLHLVWRDPADHVFPYDVLNNRTALELFSGGEDRLYGSEANSCNGRLLNAAPGWDATLMRHGRGHQFYGVNGTDDDKNMRMGFASNDEDNNAWGVKTFMGSNNNSLRWRAGHTDCNNCNGCYGNTDDITDPLEITPTSANVWVR
jgi:hypothetical protein